MTKELTIKKKIGRPLSINEDKTRELEELFRVGSTVEQACNYAGISTPTFYDMLSRSVEFANRMSHAQSFINVEAKRVIADDIVNNHEVKTSLEYLKATEWRPKETTAFATDGDNAVKFIVTRG